MSEPAIWFLAHPVAADEQYSVVGNLLHVESLVRLALSAGIMVIAPYHLTCRVLDDTVAADRKLGMAINDALLRKLDGRLILAGHKRSAGMQHELELVTGMWTHSVIDVVGIPDRWFVKQIGEAIGTQPLTGR